MIRIRNPIADTGTCSRPSILLKWRISLSEIILHELYQNNDIYKYT